MSIGYAFLHDMVGGASLGKRVYHLAVQTKSGQPTGFWAALLRSIILFVPFLGLIDVVICLFNPEGQRLSDRLLGFKVAVVQAPGYARTSWVQIFGAATVSIVITWAISHESKPLLVEIPKQDYAGLVGIERLTAAAENADLKEMEKLIHNGVGPNQVNKYGRSPLDYAALSANINAVTFLLNSGADACMLTNQLEGTGERVSTILKRVINNSVRNPAKNPNYLEILKHLEGRRCQ